MSRKVSIKEAIDNQEIRLRKTIAEHKAERGGSLCEHPFFRIFVFPIPTNQSNFCL
uniref:Uncharacterized protein n=1 Tax=Candidatus Kentrum sp. UNK TaxID=2126344 RepID=A0A451AUI8_9GAMM|nr:MAG: hypothetical protein BECKUNK1418G_GA0071005_100153 [Candidatus Kentron sp. UNK]VFK69716.1 MAG: hypothetical protein BECKUNK1418H_GA0071006_101820 [Candidatus Kentron sp. UNK]